MIEPKHISAVQISFLDASSKEGVEFLLGDVEVQYFEGDRRITQIVKSDPFLQDFINNLTQTINETHGQR